MAKKAATNTPSASPLSRPLPPPPKGKQRAVSRSAPSPVSRAAASADFDVHGARRESSIRVLDVWSQLAERYTRRLDEDDIVDLASASLVKDRGVLRRSSQYDLGCFAEGNNLSTTGGSEGAADVDDDFDELDAFAIEADIPDEMEKQLSRTIPPVQMMDPADEEDLSEFLEAERKRKMLCGDEDDHSDDDPEYAEESEGDEDLEEELADEHVDDLEVVELPVPHGSDCSDNDQDSDKPRTQVANPDPPPQDEGSDDELGQWDVNEGNTVYLLPNYSDSPEVEILPPSPPPALAIPSRRPRGFSKSVSDRIVKTK
jgi:Centromere protein Scm3